MYIPRMLRAVALFLELTEAQTRYLAGALRHSKWTRPQAWVAELQALERQEVSLADAMCTESLAPTVVVTIVEDLTKERRLSRGSAARIEASVLAQVDATGRWKGQPPQAGRPVALPAELSSWISHYWH
jgi:hypothetical protein